MPGIDLQQGSETETNAPKGVHFGQDSSDQLSERAAAAITIHSPAGVSGCHGGSQIDVTNLLLLINQRSGEVGEQRQRASRRGRTQAR